MKSSEDFNFTVVSDLSLNGKYLCIGRRDLAVEVWDLSDYNIIKTFQGSPFTRSDYSTSLNSISYFPNEEYIAISSHSKEGEIRVVSTFTGKVLWSKFAHSDSIQALSVTPNGKYVVSGSNDLAIKFWESQTGRLVHSLQSRDYIKDIDFSSDNKYMVIATCGNDSDHKVSLYDFNSRTLLKHYGKYESIDNSCITKCVIAPDDEYMITSSVEQDNGGITIWNMMNGKPFKRLYGRNDWEFYYYESIVFTPDERYIIGGSNYEGIIDIWNFPKGDLVKTIFLGSPSDAVNINGLHITPDGKYLISCSDYIRIWDFEKVLNLKEDRIWVGFN